MRLNAPNIIENRDVLSSNENTHTTAKKLKESTTHPTIPFTSKVKRILQVALDMVNEGSYKKNGSLGREWFRYEWGENKGAAEFRKNLSKFFDINLSLSHDLSFIFEYNIKIGNEKVSTWVLPPIYESNVYVYGDYDTHHEYVDCGETGISLGPWAEGEECECERGTIYDSEEDEYRACTDSELDTIHSDEECECEYWHYSDVELYYYPIYETQIYSTVDPETAGCDHTEHTHLSDYIHCLESTGDVVRVMSEIHISDTDYELEDDFDYGLDQEIADDSGRPWASVEFEEHNPSVEMIRLNDLYPDSTPTSEELNESALPSSSLTTGTKRILQVALNMSLMATSGENKLIVSDSMVGDLISRNLVKFFHIRRSIADDMGFIAEYNIKLDKDKVEDWIIPQVYETILYSYGDYDSETFWEDCEEDGTTWEGDECECIKGDIWDEDGEDHRACTESELEEVHYDDECKCKEWDEVEIEKYSYPIIENVIYTTEDPQEIGCDGVEVEVGLEDFKGCMDMGDSVVRVMSQSHHDDTPPERYDDFKEGLEDTMASDDWSTEYDSFQPFQLIRDINDMFPDTNLPDDPSPLNEEELKGQQMTMFPTGHWRFPVGKEGEAVKEIQEQLPEHIVKLIFQQWDKEEPLQMNDKDFKLFGIPHKVRLLIALIVRYLQNTTRPIPVRRVWDCEDLKYLFTKEDRHIVQKYLCEEDFDYDSIYGYHEWDEGMLYSLDDMSWNYITTLLGVDKSTAENLLGDNPQTDEEELSGEKEDYIDKIKDLIRWANEHEVVVATYNAIRDNIKDKIEEHFEHSGKFDYNSEVLVYEIEADLKDYVQDPNAWDNTDRFQSHEDFSGQHLEDILYDINLESDSTPNPYPSPLSTIPNVIFDIFMVEDFSTQWYSDKHELTVDTKFFDSYWYPDYDINQDFMDRMGEEYYDQLKGTMNEGKSYGAEIELDHNNAYIEAGPITKTEIQILNMIMGKFSQQELTDLTTIDYHNVGLDLEIKWSNFIKLIGEKTGNSEDFAKSTRWAKWVLDNRDRAEGANEDGEVVIDFNNIDILTRNYPSVYEVEGDESIWQREYRRAAVEIPAFDDEDARERANASFWEYDPEFETYDYGDSDTDEFNIEDITHYQTLKEQIIDTENLPEEELSPDLVEGDKVFVWDVVPDPAPPGTVPNTLPSAFIGTVTEVMPDDVIDKHAYRGGIKYMVDSMSGLIGLHPGRRKGEWARQGIWVEGGRGRDKWVKLNKENLQEIKKITSLKNIERQKDFTLKRSFMESINNLTEKEIIPIKESVVESRVTLFDYLDGLSKSSLVNENELPELLIGGRNWTDKFTVSKSMDLDDLKENSNKVRDIVFNNTKLKLSKKLENPSFIETKRDLLETAKSIVTLWEESRRNKNRVS